MCTAPILSFLLLLSHNPSSFNSNFTLKFLGDTTHHKFETMDLIKTICPCLNGLEFDEDHPSDQKVSTVNTSTVEPTEEEIAASIVSLLFSTEKRACDLDRLLQDDVHTCGWYESLAKRILDGIVAALNASATMGGAMKEAFDKASAKVEEFVKEHPILTAVMVTVVAMGILALLAPWAISALGFGELGPVEGTY
jgi:hypothetical protein